MKISCGTLVALGCWLIGCTLAQARIGETEKQCEERYGKPTPAPRDKSLMVYRKADFIVFVHFYEGVCDQISYRKVEENAPGVGKEISVIEREYLLRTNGGSREWKEGENIDTGLHYEAKDGKLCADYVTAKNLLIIWTEEAHKRAAAAMIAEEEKKLKGF